MANNTGLDEADVAPGDLRNPVSAKTQPVSGHTTCQIPDIENSCGRDSSRKTPPLVGSARFSSPKTRPLPANPRECRRFSHTWKSHRRDRTDWLGRQDSNLGMAESNLLFHTSIGTALSNGSIFHPVGGSPPRPTRVARTGARACSTSRGWVRCVRVYAAARQAV